MNFLMLSKTLLFRGLSPDEIQHALDCLGTQQKQFEKGEAVYHAGDIIHAMGMVMTGSIFIENNDLWGNKTVLDKVEKGRVFGQAYACACGEPLMVSVIAAEKSVILFLQTDKLLTVSPQSCPYHNKIIQNLVSIFAQKNLHLSRRMFHISLKSIRGRLLSYLSHQAAKTGSWDFEIPFNRQQLANYLSVDRSALSNEISKMQKEQLISVQKNRFHIIRTTPFENLR